MTKSRQINQIATVLLCVLSFAILGCEQQPLKIIAKQSAKPLPMGEESDGFLDRISSQDNVTENDAMRGVLMLINGEDTAKSFAERTRLLAEKNIVSRNWTFSGDRPITRGKLAYIIYQACEMGGGVILAVTGPSQRYCLRELQFQKMMSKSGSFYSNVSGMEFVAVLGRADVFKRTGKVPTKAGDIEED